MFTSARSGATIPAASVFLSMPKFQFLSDVHRRWHRVSPSPEANLFLALGDLSEDLQGLHWLAGFHAPSLYVPGNHEYYGSDLGTRLSELRAAARGSRVNIVDRQTVVAGSVRFLCATLWSDHGHLDPFLVQQSLHKLNDCRQISCSVWLTQDDNRVRYHAAYDSFAQRHPSIAAEIPRDPELMNPLVSYCLHQQALEFLGRELAAPWPGQTVVLTHHAPLSYCLLASRYFSIQQPGFLREAQPDLRDRPHKIGAYASQLEFLFSRHSITAWLHGHLHEGIHFRYRGCNILANPSGYNDQQNPSHSSSFLLDFQKSQPFNDQVLHATITHGIQLQRSLLAFLSNESHPAVRSDQAPRELSESQLSLLSSHYNALVSPLLPQNLRERARPEFFLTPIHLDRMLQALRSRGPSTAPTLAAIIALLQQNLSKSQNWQADLQSQPHLKNLERNLF